MGNSTSAGGQRTKPPAKIVSVQPKTPATSSIPTHGDRCTEEATDTSQFESIAPPMMPPQRTSPPRLRKHKTHKSSAFNVEPESHTLLGGDARPSDIQHLVEHLIRKKPVALQKLKKYVGHDCRDAIRLFHPTAKSSSDEEAVDLVRNRVSEVHLEGFARCVWGTLTTPATHPGCTIECLERINDNTIYNRITIDDVPLVMHLLSHQTRSPNRIVIVFRNIVDDGQFPLEGQPYLVLLSGWLVLDRDQQATHARTFVKFRGTQVRQSNNNVDKTSEESTWLDAIATKLFDLVETTNKTKLHGTIHDDPGTTTATRRKHSAASNGNCFESR
ncbi:unnamed protein product [Aphanomyces euteiches]|uniref:Uncharacterized protein n=1 Tax=Aphanomyces euteiches TaxID=100861 RepID=A0A6G0XID7_9STRA|nr:hypothetical protein Ae201684_004347 [Aphanomyces euteiches]KAH9093833.1 hypothetical protein Ae201684P_016455 [Aphanomyces euteiches]KAH9136277.1 hypothetical protein AeRB84_018498 [Aphanomyces euteiches]